MSKTDAAWLAGFLDGEGTIQRYEGHPPHRRPRWAISVTNTHRGSLERCLAITEAGQVVVVKMYPTNRKQPYRWSVTAHNDVVDIVRQVAPYLTIKIDRAMACLAEEDD